jgi:hypothetical protein
MNASLQGWVGYFHYRNSTKVLGKVKQHAEERLRTHLRKRHQVKDRAYIPQVADTIWREFRRSVWGLKCRL